MTHVDRLAELVSWKRSLYVLSGGILIEIDNSGNRLRQMTLSPLAPIDDICLDRFRGCFRYGNSPTSNLLLLRRNNLEKISGDLEVVQGNLAQIDQRLFNLDTERYLKEFQCEGGRLLAASKGYIYLWSKSSGIVVRSRNGRHLLASPMPDYIRPTQAMSFDNGILVCFQVGVAAERQTFRLEVWRGLAHKTLTTFQTDGYRRPQFVDVNGSPLMYYSCAGTTTLIQPRQGHMMSVRSTVYAFDSACLTRSAAFYRGSLYIGLWSGDVRRIMLPPTKG
jgi:hypothetical protein